MQAEIVLEFEITLSGGRQMASTRPVLVAAFACFALMGMSAAVHADSGIFEPRGPVISGRDPLFMGMVIAPGTNSCRRVYEPYYGWNCKYGKLPPGPGKRGLGGVYADDDQTVTPKAKTKQVYKAKVRAAKKTAKSEATR
jgi:hypothetical protein